MKLNIHPHVSLESYRRNTELTLHVSAVQVSVVNSGKTRVPSKHGLPPPHIYHWSAPWRRREMELFPYLWHSCQVLDRSFWSTVMIPKRSSFILMSYQPLGTYGMGQRLPYLSCHHPCHRRHRTMDRRRKVTMSTGATLCRMFQLAWFPSGHGISVSTTWKYKGNFFLNRHRLVTIAFQQQ
jgi:hypothetical protein